MVRVRQLAPLARYGAAAATGRLFWATWATQRVGGLHLGIQQTEAGWQHLHRRIEEHGRQVALLGLPGMASPSP